MYKTGKTKVKSITHLPEYTLNRPGEGEKNKHRAIQPNISRWQISIKEASAALTKLSQHISAAAFSSRATL